MHKIVRCADVAGFPQLAKVFLLPLEARLSGLLPIFPRGQRQPIALHRADQAGARALRHVFAGLLRRAVVRRGRIHFIAEPIEQWQRD